MQIIAKEHTIAGQIRNVYENYVHTIHLYRCMYNTHVCMIHMYYDWYTCTGVCMIHKYYETHVWYTCTVYECKNMRTHTHTHTHLQSISFCWLLLIINWCLSTIIQKYHNNKTQHDIDNRTYIKIKHLFLCKKQNQTHTMLKSCDLRMPIAFMRYSTDMYVMITNRKKWNCCQL